MPAPGWQKAPASEGFWVVLDASGARVSAERTSDGLAFPRGPRDRHPAPIYLGLLDGVPCWAARSNSGDESGESILPWNGTRLPDAALTIAGLARHLMQWREASVHCPACGASTSEIAGAWGRRCDSCRYEHYPRLQPAVLVLVHDGRRCLLTRRPDASQWGLVAGFVCPGESLEEAARRECLEEVGLKITGLVYAGSQPWPFPSQIMTGFYARAVSSAARPDGVEITEVCWCVADQLPQGPSQQSLARAMLDRFAESGAPSFEAP